MGFVGRVVPIKDVISFIQACNLAWPTSRWTCASSARPARTRLTSRRCLTLVETLGLTSSVVFTGPQPAHLIYSDLDVVVLTSFSEGQPLVILEAYAAGLPVIATDVGACREMIEGRSAPDRLLGGSGVVTRVGTASETAAALVRLARDPPLRRRLGTGGSQARPRLLSSPGHDRQLPRPLPGHGVAIAGIGWKLQRLIDRGSLTGALGAYLTGVVVTSAPWLLTTAVLLGLRLFARSAGTSEFLVVEQTVTIVYALTVVLSAPMDVVLSRHASDRLYDRRLEAIAAPLGRGLAITVVGFAVVGAAVMALLRVPLAFVVPGTVLTVVVGAQWLMLSVGSGLSSPNVVLGAFGLGAPVSVVAALALGRGLGLGAVGYLYGFGIGQLCTLVLLLVGVMRVLPANSDERERLWPAFVEYKLLAAASFAYHLSIWADKPILWLLAGRQLAALYTASAALSWFSVIPAFAWIYVQIETVFYQRYRAFYSSLEGGGTLPLLRQRAQIVRAEALRILRGAALVQGGGHPGRADGGSPRPARGRPATGRGTDVPPCADWRGDAARHPAHAFAALLLRPASQRADRRRRIARRRGDVHRGLLAGGPPAWPRLRPRLDGGLLAGHQPRPSSHEDPARRYLSVPAIRRDVMSSWHGA